MAYSFQHIVNEPQGNKEITDTNITNVSNFATAQVVDSNLTADNIKKDVSILGVTGTLESSASWGTITGTLSDQTDLQNALNAKQDSLPTATADKYLHTNASTNAIEWISMPKLVINADGSGTLVIPD